MITRDWSRRAVRISSLSATLASLWSANAAPVLTTTDYSSLIPSIAEDDTSNPGRAFTGFLFWGTDVTDSDGPGMGVAVIGVSSANGSWQYTLDGSTWISFGSVSDNHALLLDLTSAAYNSGPALRFVPNLNFNGTISPAVQFRAWDESDGLMPSGAAPCFADLSTGLQSTQVIPNARIAMPRNTQAVGGGSTAYSAEIGSYNLTVTPVNDAPVLDISGAPYLTSTVYTGAPATDAGTRIDVMLATGAHGAPISDVDVGDPQGIAIVGLDTTYGSWEFTTNAGFNWTPMTGVSPSTAVLLDVGSGIYNSPDNYRVRFTPSQAGFTGTITSALQFRAWDHSDLNPAGTINVDTTGAGGISAYSLAIETVSIFVTGSTSTVAPVVFPEPPISGAGETRYGAVCPGTPEGLTSLLDAMSGKLPSDARAFAWDGVTQKFVELPNHPTTGLHPDTGFFLATRVPLPIDFAGSLTAIPCVLTLQPGWNLVGVPALDNAGTTTLSHPWDDFALFDDTATQVTDPLVFADVLGTPSSGDDTTARPWYWDGSGYQQVTTLDTGKAYWIKNNASVVYTLQRTATSQSPLPRLARSAAAVPRGTITDRGTPPRPPTAAAAEPSRGCGLGTGLGVLVLSMAGLLRRRRD
jgi:hypothetical protein